MLPRPPPEVFDPKTPVIEQRKNLSHLLLHGRLQRDVVGVDEFTLEELRLLREHQLLGIVGVHDLLLVVLPSLRVVVVGGRFFLLKFVT